MYLLQTLQSSGRALAAIVSPALGRHGLTLHRRKSGKSELTAAHLSCSTWPSGTLLGYESLSAGVRSAVYSETCSVAWLFQSGARVGHCRVEPLSEAKAHLPAEMLFTCIKLHDKVQKLYMTLQSLP